MKLDFLMMLIVFVICVICAVIGWGISFAFTYNVFVPWLHVPEQWHNAAAFITAFLFDGLATGIVLLLTFGAILGILKLLIAHHNKASERRALEYIERLRQKNNKNQ